MPDARELPALCRRFLELTDDPRFYLETWKSRAWCRNILLRCRCRPHYLLTVDALENVSEVEDLLAALDAATIPAVASGCSLKGTLTMDSTINHDETAARFDFMDAEPCPSCGLLPGEDGHGAVRASMVRPIGEQEYFLCRGCYEKVDRGEPLDDERIAAALAARPAEWQARLLLPEHLTA